MESSLSEKNEIIQKDEWQSLKAFTSARIALGRTGSAIPLAESLEFKLAHAFARDAVYISLETDQLINSLQAFKLPFYVLHSKAENRLIYLQRPDLGRILNAESANQLMEEKDNNYDISIILADGLSGNAINFHAVNFLSVVMPALQLLNYKIAPFTLVKQARVAIGDEIGSLLNSKMSIILIGERPGLSSPDSMGVYLTYSPSIGLTDESRNCISNIRPQGLQFEEAKDKLLYLINESFRLKLSGVELKDNAGLLK